MIGHGVSENVFVDGIRASRRLGLGINGTIYEFILKFPTTPLFNISKSRKFHDGA